ncbi:MAG TPA: universal stress protein, partial [Acidimicrobiales bacterium]|nr:universal stress protein [Acidimicrobiales bacterium]
MPRTSTRDHAGEARVTAAELAHVIVPLDGSDESGRAVPVARQLAALLGADLTFLGVATPGMDRGALQVLLEEAAVPVGGELTVAVVDGKDGVAPAIAAVGVQLPRHVVCMASHGRGRAAGLVGSVATGLAAAAREPLVVVGPEVPVGHYLAGRLVACVDGSMRSEAGLPTMAAWARSLRLAMTLVTVAEPIPAPVTPGAPYRRTHGPSMGAEDYVEGLVR